MRKLSYIELISPYGINVEGVGIIKSPTIKDIVDLGVNEFSQNKYDGYLNILCMSAKAYFEAINQSEIFNRLSEDEQSQINVFDIWVSSDTSINIVKESLSFFIDGDIFFDKTNASLIVVDPIKKISIGIIDRENFSDVCSVIKRLNFIDDNFENAKPKNKIAEKILAKLKKGQQASSGNKANKDINVANMVSALSVQHNSYNLTNIWSLTVYQLYDQFFRQNTKNQIDISATRWAAWGEKAFDYELWFKSIKN